MNNTIKMTQVKLDAGYTDNGAFYMTFRQGVEKGVKFERDKSEVYDTIVFDINELPETIYRECPAARHGLKQKMGDNLAMTKELKEATTITMAITACNELWEQLKLGNWNSVAKGAKAPSVKLSDLETKFLAGLASGMMDYETANNLYKGITGKELPKPEEKEENEE